MTGFATRSRAYAFGSIGLAVAVVIAGGMLYLTSATASTTASNSSGADLYKVDVGHSFILFRVEHLGVSYAYGRFNAISGSFSLDTSNPGASTFDIEVESDSVDTGNGKRDQHIKSPDFFNTKQFPVIRFRGTRLESKGGDRYELTGELTLHGKTKTITANLEYVGDGKDPWGGYRAGFETTFAIKRSDFGMDYMMGALGDDVRLTVAIEGIRQ